MIIVILIASILMASISIIQFKNEARDYHQERLDRKEFAIKEHINYVLSTTTYPLTPENLPLIFKDKIHELADIHNLEINIYSLDGKACHRSASSPASWACCSCRHSHHPAPLPSSCSCGSPPPGTTPSWCSGWYSANRAWTCGTKICAGQNLPRWCWCCCCCWRSAWRRRGFFSRTRPFLLLRLR